MPEIHPGDEIAELVVARIALEDGDVVVVTQKIVSKAEGRLEKVTDDAGRLRLIERESVRVLRRRDELVISETQQGFVCANAGVDLSNVDDGVAALLPVDADRSARHIRDALAARAGIAVAVVRGVDRSWLREGSVRTEIVRPHNEDLFR